MCFSATASFATTAGLSVMGLLSVHAAKNNRSMLPLAASPLFFAAQQACEGLVWVTLNAGDSTSLLHNFGMYGFICFAGIFWPIWVPLALYIPEQIPHRKKWLFILLLIGCLTAILLFFTWILKTTGAQIINHHIDYPVPGYSSNLTSLGYCIAVIMPFFISSIQYVWMAGIVITIAFITSLIFYYMTFGSVWCFFAAVSSALLYVIIKKHAQ